MQSDTTLANGDRGFDVFISFVTAPDYDMARKVRNFLESFSQRVKSSGFDIAPIRAFLDTDNLSRRASDTVGASELGDALRNELLRSDHLLILCCRSTPRSEWVRREFEWYSQARGTDNVLLGVTDPIDPRVDPKSVFPDYIMDLGLENRLWYDFRSDRSGPNNPPGVRPIEDVLTQLAAHLTGRAVAEVTSAWYREQRRLARTRMVYLTVAAVATVAAVVGGYQTYISRTAAERSAADQFIQSGLKAEAEADLIGAASAFRASMKHADTNISRLELAGLTTIPIRPLHMFALPVVNGSGNLTAATFIAGQVIAAGDKEGNVILLDIDNASVLRVIKLPSGVNALAFFADEERLFAGLENGSVFVIDTHSGDASKWKDFAQPVLGLRAESKKDILAVGLARNAGVLVLDRNGHELMRMDVHTDDVQGLAFNFDGSFLYWGGSGPYLWACHVDGTGCEPMTKVDQFVYSIDGSANARYGVVATGDHVILFDHVLGKLTTLSELGGGHAYSVAFDPSSQYIAIAASDGIVRVYDVQSGRILLRSRSHRGEAVSIVFNSNGDRMVSVGSDGHVDVWKVERSGIVMPSQVFRPMPGMLTPTQRNQIVDMRVLDNDVALVQTSDQHTRAYDLDRLLPSTKELENDELRKQIAVSFSHAQAFPAFDGFSEIATWQVEPPTAVVGLEDVSADGAIGSISADARYLAVALKDGRILLFDAEHAGSSSGKGATSRPSSIAVLAGQPPSIAVGYEDGTLSVFDGKTLQLRNSRKVHDGPINLMLFSEPAGLLFTSGQDGWTRAIAPVDGRELHAFETLAARAIAVSYDGKILAIGGLTGVIHVLDASNMQLLATLPGNRGGVNALGFDRTGARLYSGGFDEMLRRWDVNAINVAAFGSVSDVVSVAETLPQPQAVALRGKTNKVFGHSSLSRASE